MSQDDIKLYTKRGDDGKTDLFGGQRVAKHHLRVEAYGTVDELISCMGLATSICKDARLGEVLYQLQVRLFELGADLATPRKESDELTSVGDLQRINEQHSEELEKLIDEMCEDVEPLKNFILPGGCELAARLHLGRTVCRRAERICTTLADHENIGSAVIVYLNRMSDLLFAMARKANKLAGMADVPWIPGG